MAEKMFIHVAKKASLTQELKNKYNSSIVFIKDTLEIYTHGTFYGIPEEWQNKITTAEDAIKALQGIKSFGVIEDGNGNKFEATDSARNVKIVGSGIAKVTASADGFTVNVPEQTLTGGTEVGTVRFNNKQIAIPGMALAASQANKAYNLTGADKTIKVNNLDTSVQTAPTIELVTDNSGNVKFTHGTNGLSASVDIPSVSVPVQGVADNDPLLTLDGTKISSEISIAYDSEDKKIYLKGAGDKVIGEGIDATDFIKDGMLADAKLTDKEDGKTYLVLTFNTDAGRDDVEVDVTRLIDKYTANNIVLEAPYQAAATWTAIKAGDSVQTAISKLEKKDVDISEELKTTNTNLETAGRNITSLINRVTTLEGNSVSTLEVTNSNEDYLKLEKGSKGDATTLTLSGTIKSTKQSIDAVKDAGDGLATATAVKAYSDAMGESTLKAAKSYADSLFVWEEIN